MAFLQTSFKAKQMGDNSSETTSYIAEIVSCSNTTTPISVNGYVFKTTISNAPKTGTIEIIFSNVPPNTIIPENNKLKITGTKNGNPIVKYQDCNPAKLIICSENATQTCTISNVQMGQVICN